MSKTKITLAPIVQLSDLGKIDFRDAWKLQENAFQNLMQQKVANRGSSNKLIPLQNQKLFLCEHKPVFTLGKSGKQQHLLVDTKILNADFVHINRGGDITYHGPGQITGYPILDLESFHLGLKEYIHKLENMIIRVLANYRLKGEKLDGATGVWLDIGNPSRARKICAIGIRSSRYITMHGFAFNVNTDLRYFDKIVPCGISGKSVTSLEAELGKKVPMAGVKSQITEAFSEEFNCVIASP